MKNYDYELTKQLKGGLDKMEKILTMFGLFGLTLVIVGTLTACQASKQEAMQNAASQVEISTESNVQSEEDLRKEIEALTQEVVNNSKNNTQEKIEKAEKQFISEAQNYWKIKQDELSVCIENGLQYSEFEKNYLFYRAGIDELGIVDADYACELTLIEMNRLYGSTIGDYSALDSNNVKINEDGSVEYTDEFMGALLSYSYFEGASTEEVNEFLKTFLPITEGMSGEDIHHMLSMFNGSNLHKENETITQSEAATSTENSSNSNSSNSNSSSNNNVTNGGNSGTSGSNQTPETVGSSADWNIDTSIWGDVDTSPVGGQGQGEIPEGFTGIH